MQQGTRVGGDSWRSGRKTQNPSTVATQCGRTTSTDLLPEFHILRAQKGQPLWTKSAHQAYIESNRGSTATSRTETGKYLCGRLDPLAAFRHNSPVFTIWHRPTHAERTIWTLQGAKTVFSPPMTTTMTMITRSASSVYTKLHML